MDTRTDTAKPEAPAPACCSDPCAEAPTTTQAPLSANDRDTTRFRIATMDCAAEESEIRRALDPISGIRHLRFDLGQRLLDLSGTPQAIEQAAIAMRRVGFDPQPLAMAAEPGAATPGTVADSADPVPFGAGLWRLVAALALAVGAEVLAFFAPDLLPWRFATMALALAAIALAGFSTYKKGFAALRAGRLNINALMTVAVTGAFVIGQWPEAAMVMALYAIAELIEARAVDRARNAIRRPAGAGARRRRRAAAGRQLVERARRRRSRVGAIVRVRPGERVPLDGERHRRQQRASTRRRSPARAFRSTRAPATQVFAGTINETGTLEFRVTAPASDIDAGAHHPRGGAGAGHARADAALRRPLRRASTRRRCSRWRWRVAVLPPLAARLDLAAGALQGAGAAGHRLPLRAGDLDAGDGRQRPGRGGAARHPDQGRRLPRRGAQACKAVALDKTGTLTEGKPRLVDFEPVADGARCRTAAAAGREPGRALRPSGVARHRRTGWTRQLPSRCRTSRPLPGRGVQARHRRRRSTCSATTG